MISQDDVDFLGFRCKSTNGSLANPSIKKFSIDNPYKYEYYTYQIDSSEVNNKQGLTNCVKKSIELFKEGKIALWLPKNVFENLTPETSNNLFDATGYSLSNVTPLCLEEYLKTFTDHGVKQNSLLRKLGSILYFYGMSATCKIGAEDLISCSIIIEPYESKFSSYEAKILLESLQSLGLVKCYMSGMNNLGEIVVTPDGWLAIGENENIHNKKVFIAMSFADWENDTIRTEVEIAIKTACHQIGYEASTVSQDHTEYITDRIITEIKQAKFVIADFTHHNRGVYYEAGYAKALGKNVFHIVRKSDEKDSEKFHFDIRHIQYRKWNTPEDIIKILPDWIMATLK